MAGHGRRVMSQSCYEPWDRGFLAPSDGDVVLLDGQLAFHLLLSLTLLYSPIPLYREYQATTMSVDLVPPRLSVFPPGRAPVCGLESYLSRGTHETLAICNDPYRMCTSLRVIYAKDGCSKNGGRRCKVCPAFECVQPVVDLDFTSRRTSTATAASYHPALGFARRYFTLKPDGVLVYSTHPGQTPRDSIPLQLATITSSERSHSITVDSGTKTFHIRCASPTDFQKWMTAFRCASVM